MPWTFVKEVGFRTALVQDIPVTVSDGKLDIQFAPIINRPSIAAIEVLQIQYTGTLQLTAKDINGANCGENNGSIEVEATGATNLEYKL
ncbi:MAG: hypothetical protein HC880_05585, partial [Bacteroidia bacterium]|nr:hypothetical protein [Bacteroidia bacterium]